MASTINAKSTGSGSLESTADASGVLALQTGGVTAVTIDTSQNVGIGTTSPAFASGTGMQVKGSGDTNIRLSSGSTTGLDLIKISDGTSYLWNRDNASLLFGTNNAERMRIDSSGNVGIGTTSPAYKLDVNYSSASVIQARVKNTNTTSQSAQLVTSNDSDVYVGLGVFGSSAGSYGPLSAGSPFVTTAAAELNIIANNASGVIKLSTGSTPAERMRIDSSGNVGIGNASPNTRLIVSANTGTAVQRIFNLVGTNTYQMSFHNSTQECGTITTGNNTVGYNSNSDYRLKENIAPMTGALDKIAKLKPVTYTWKASGTNGQGFIAHELQEHFSDAVSGEKDAVDEEGKPIYQGVDTSFLVATLTAAIQEQQTIINDLKARIETLEGAK